MAEEKGSNNFGWFVAGLGLGALIGVLYAPKSGRETREDIVTGAREGSEYLKHRSREAVEQIGAIVDRGKAQVTEYVDRGKDYVDRGREQWDEFLGRSREFVSQQTEKVSAAVDAGKQAYRSSTIPENNNN